MERREFSGCLVFFGGRVDCSAVAAAAAAEYFLGVGGVCGSVVQRGVDARDPIMMPHRL